MVPFLGLPMLLRVPSICLKLLLVATLLVLLLSGVSRMVSMQMRLLHGCLIHPRFGQMVAWSWTRSLVFLLLVLVCLLTCLFTAGVAAGGAMLIVFSRIVLLIRGFVSVPGPLQTVQRAELWVVILALQSSDAVHVGVYNLCVVRHIGRLLDDCYCSSPLELVTDGDSLVLIRRMLDLRGRNTVNVAEVKRSC